MVSFEEYLCQYLKCSLSSDMAVCRFIIKDDDQSSLCGPPHDPHSEQHHSARAASQVGIQLLIQCLYPWQLKVGNDELHLNPNDFILQLRQLHRKVHSLRHQVQSGSSLEDGWSSMWYQ